MMPTPSLEAMAREIKMGALCRHNSTHLLPFALTKMGIYLLLILATTESEKLHLTARCPHWQEVHQDIKMEVLFPHCLIVHKVFAQTRKETFMLLTITTELERCHPRRPSLLLHRVP